MKLIFGVILLVGAVLAGPPPKVYKVEDLSAYNYHERIGIPAAIERKKLEEDAMATGDYSRIVNGSPALMEDFPYQAGMFINLKSGSRSICGAVLISNNRVLTAAHCWNDGVNDGVSVEVVLGSLFLYLGGTRITSYVVETHEGWDRPNVQNDIAMIYIGWIDSTEFIQPIALPETADELYVGEMAVASGYGRTGTSIPIPVWQFLSYIWVPVITNQVCSTVYPGFILDQHVCIDATGPLSTCNGDSGGPLAVERNGTRTLIGLTSFGSTAGCDFGIPTAFVRITYYLDWIRRRM